MRQLLLHIQILRRWRKQGLPKPSCLTYKLHYHRPQETVILEVSHFHSLTTTTKTNEGGLPPKNKLNLGRPVCEQAC